MSIRVSSQKDLEPLKGRLRQIFNLVFMPQKGYGFYMVSETASRIGGMLREVARLQKASVEKICILCETPCCARVQYLFGEKDILFLRLTGREGKWRKEAYRRKGCSFLGAEGCILDLLSRPFICHSYICLELEAEMNRCDSGLIQILRERFKTIGTLRSQMWLEYLEEGRNQGQVEHGRSN